MFFVCVLSKSREAESAQGRGAENRVDCMGKLVPVDTVVWFYTPICETEDFAFNPFRDRQPVQ